MRDCSTAVTVGSTKMEGTSGVLVHQTTRDVWIWETPLQDFQQATSVACDQFFAFASGQQQPIGGTFTCRSIDGDVDVSINTGTFQADSIALITQIAGTGKWAQHVRSQLIGKTDIQADRSTSVHSWTPKKIALLTKPISKWGVITTAPIRCLAWHLTQYNLETLLI